MGLKRHYFRDDSDIIKNKYLSDLKLFVEYMQRKYNLTVYLIYGTLLGAIREKDFIAHDTDIDIAYLSRYTTKIEVNNERKILIKSLQNSNLLRTTKTRGIKVKFNDSKFDMWTSYIDNENFYLKPFGKICSKDKVLPMKELKFRNEVFLVPKDSEYVLNVIYTTWKKPLSKTEQYLKVKYES